jgi:hypothetical protein
MPIYVAAATGAPHNEPCTYRFRGAGATRAWPRRDGLHLGACGMWNFLWRLGFHPADARLDALPTPTADHVLFAQLDSSGPDATDALRRWRDAGGRLIAAGSVDAWNLLGLDDAWQSHRPENPYAGLGYRIDGISQLIAPAGWAFGSRARSRAGVRDVGTVVVIGGERQTPSRALVSVAGAAPALSIGIDGAFAYVNANPFAAFQAWLQGQEDLQPWLAWRHRLFWLDEWVSSMATLLAAHGLLSLDSLRPGIRGLADTTVVLRHDVDHSRDTSYLDVEEQRGISATHAILDDEHAAFWVDALAKTSQESAFHYTTGRRDWVGTVRGRVRGRRSGVMQPARAAVTGTGLLRQLTRARQKGIRIATLHRHLLFLQYPEWIDALDHVFEKEPDVLGASSLFRAQVLRWGGDATDGVSASTGEWPDAQFPLWMPFKACHAGDRGRRLRGWESTSLMETEPALVEQLLNHRVPHLPQRVLTLGFHPAHASRPTFAQGGSFASFVATLDLLATRGTSVRTLADVYALADRSTVA